MFVAQRPKINPLLRGACKLVLWYNGICDFISQIDYSRRRLWNFRALSLLWYIL